MSATRAIRALLILSLLVAVPAGLAQAATDQAKGQGKSVNLYTQTEAQRAGMEFETGNEFPLRVPDLNEAAHLRKPSFEHFLSVEKKAARRQMEAQIRYQDEVSGYSF